MKSQLRPWKPLTPGASVALLAPASPHKSAEEVAAATERLAEFGLKVVQFPSLRARADFLAGPDALRAKDVNRAFADPKIEAIFALRGGYGCARLLPLLDWKMIRKSRKLLVGFSDLTALHCGLSRAANLQCIHAPTMAHFIKRDEGGDASHAALKAMLLGGEMPALKGEVVVRGSARGVLVGGNLTVLASLAGTPWMPRPKQGILFLEDIHEKPYRLDRCLTQLRLCGFMDGIVGVALGGFTDCSAGPGREDALTVLAKALKPLRIPALAGLPCGHDRLSLPLPMGAMVEIARGSLRLAVTSD